MLRKTIAAILVSTVFSGIFVTGVAAQEQSSKGTLDFTIDNPYASVNWSTYGQYKADFHAHSNESDGSPQPADTVEEHYKKGYDILALTDHNVTNTTWNRKDDLTGKGRTYLTDERLEEITNGIGRDGRGMVAIINSDEQSESDHLNTFFTPFNNESGATLESNIAKTQKLGGICHINHPGRYTGGKNTSGTVGEEASNNPITVQKYVDLFTKYSACVGMEIINKLDGDSYSDRILWDNILKETMPKGRFVWGFSNDDTHSNSATGHSYNMMLLPSNTAENVRAAMENGAFYASAKVAKREGYTVTDIATISDYRPPIITNITVDQTEDTITIEGNLYDTIEWIADGEVIATGNTIDLNQYEDKVNSYVRAQLKGREGISFTQPFGISTDTTELENNVIVMKFDAAKAFVNDNVYDTTKYQNGYAKLININGTAMMPLRYIAEVNGFNVIYDEATSKIKVVNKTDDSYLMISPGSMEVGKYAADGSLLGTANAPNAFEMQNGITIGSLRYTCEALGKSVRYQETSHGIYVVISSQVLSVDEADAWIEKANVLGL